MRYEAKQTVTTKNGVGAITIRGVWDNVNSNFMAWEEAWDCDTMPIWEAMAAAMNEDCE